MKLSMKPSKQQQGTETTGRKNGRFSQGYRARNRVTDNIQMLITNTTPKLTASSTGCFPSLAEDTRENHSQTGKEKSIPCWKGIQYVPF